MPASHAMAPWAAGINSEPAWWVRAASPCCTCSATCVDLIRTLPALQHDADRPEDVDSDGEDHAPDEARYACMSRPYVRAAPDVVKPKFALDRTFNEIVAANRKRRIGDDE
jgi:nitrate reductase beta subunit